MLCSMLLHQETASFFSLLFYINSKIFGLLISFYTTPPILITDSTQPDVLFRAPWIVHQLADWQMTPLFY